MEKHLRRSNPTVCAKIRELRHEIGRQFGLASRMVVNLLGPVLWWSARREQRRLLAGETYEPQTVIERRNFGESLAAPHREDSREMVAVADGDIGAGAAPALSENSLGR